MTEEQEKLFEEVNKYAEACMKEIDEHSAKVDASPFYPWVDAQGDFVPEYGREVVVIGRDGKVFYGHRPDPKEYVVVEGEKLFAKTYDKNGWNWPDIALWLDVKVPHELVDKIATEYFKENEHKRKTISN